MSNNTQIQGAHNIVIQNVTDSTLTLNVNGEVREIQNQLAELKALLLEHQAQKVQYAEKIYNIEHITEANFGVVTSSRVFNGVLVRQLIEMLRDRPATLQFLSDVPEADREKWETDSLHLKEAQSLLEKSFVWVISWELRRLFSIGKDRNIGMDAKINNYISHCFSAYRLSLQLTNALLLSQLWDEKTRRPGLVANAPPVADFFNKKRMLKLAELRQLFLSLLGLFRDNDLIFPLDREEWGDIGACLDPGSAFNQACTTLEDLQAINENEETYGLGHCHTAEIALAEVLRAFPSFTRYQLVAMKRIEYEEARNTEPRYIKDFSILERKDARALQRVLKYDNRPAVTYAIFFRNDRHAVNLFPFFLDYNALTNEQDFQIFVYECRQDKSGLRYFSIKSEEEPTLSYRATKTDLREIQSEEQKNEEQKNIRIDLVIKQFEEAMNTLLDTGERFEPMQDTIGKLDNI
jgi:hypothetical protein